MASNTLIESLKRLYNRGTLTRVDIAQRVEKGTITVGDYESITGEAFTSQIISNSRLAKGCIL